MALPPVLVPLHHIVDSRAKWKPEQLAYFWSGLWPEAVRDLKKCGVQLQTKLKVGEVRRSPGGLPVFMGLEHRVVNFVITDNIPLRWASGRGVAGTTTLYRGYHLCMVALEHAHGHRVPLLAVNTCLHELLHALLHDIYEKRPSGAAGRTRELRIDAYATRLWLFGDGATIREAAQAYVQRLRPQ